ncbi:mitochondrial carnitine/acylcarnitine carrier-like protein [Triticum aestivum]|uniref:mitochondrial carnitine/acylcarnitine carrier-like protein n=1 Tax=Triticum aestivum TaxID=4565 RepID=UPI001D02316B|nr:mitochondrial carnitine/acylcarnitine carrier-like protein [Triticum aestivum]
MQMQYRPSNDKSAGSNSPSSSRGRLPPEGQRITLLPTARRAPNRSVAADGRKKSTRWPGSSMRCALQAPQAGRSKQSTPPPDPLLPIQSGAAQLVVGHPFDTIKVKLQSQPTPPPGQPPKFAGAMDAVKQTISAEGPRGLYKGMGAPLATVAAFNAVLFIVRGQMEALLRSEPGAAVTVGQQVVAGAGAGVAVSFLACPTELIKCRLQAQSALATAAPAAAAAAAPAGGAAATVTATANAAAVKYGGPLDVARHVLRSDGSSAAAGA